jgi:isopenicillin N synthase-like dioxygenase
VNYTRSAQRPQKMLDRLDFSDFHSTNTAERDDFCNRLVSSLKQRGFVRLVNHGVPPQDIDRAFLEVRLPISQLEATTDLVVFEQTQQFFQLPLEEKLKSPHPPTPNPHRGYSAFGVEVVATHSNYESKAPMPLLKDMKESYDIGSERDELWSNIWPPSGVQDTFQPFFTSFFSACYQAECEILEALSIGLGLPPQTLSERHVNQSNELRLTHYPAVSRSEFANSTRIATHTDFGTITLLFQDAVGGLRMAAPFFFEFQSSLLGL